MWLMAAWLEDKGEEERGRGHLAAGWVRLRQASDWLAWQSEALRGSGKAEWGRPRGPHGGWWSPIPWWRRLSPGGTCVCMNVAVVLARAINMCMFDLLGFVMHECFSDYIHGHTIA